MRQPVRVLQSFPEPRPTTNPYVVQLHRALAALPEVDVRTFGWRRALLGRYDVFHVHWPEILVEGRDRPRRLARRVLLALLLLRWTLTRTAVVRTAHNLSPHARQDRVASALLRAVDRRTRGYVRLNDATPVPAGLPVRTVAHGHYRDWYADVARPAREAGRAAFVGLVKPYKDVARLVTVFREAAHRQPWAALEVAGRPADAAIEAEVRAAAAGQPRVTLRLQHLEDAELAAVLGRASLVVLPYRELHNSGAALLALSLDRPVLLPDTGTTAALAAEVGEEWVLRFEGELTADRLLAALRQADGLPQDARPDLGAREWTSAGREHLALYREVLARR